VIPLDKHRYLVAIGDVCNKGMPAALFMAQTLAMLRSMANQEKRIEQVQLADIVSRGNDQLCMMNSEQLFVSIFLGIVDLELNQIRYVNAGHNPPMVRLPGEPLGLIDSPRNPVAGMVSSIQYKSGMLPFPVGSLLLLYTDGVTEAENAGLDQFGETALMDCFAELHGSSQALVTSIVQRVDAFAQEHPQADDITLLGLRRLH
jgi:sigma-B regulation protein RsbU (phosphoserine phosphatase)